MELREPEKMGKKDKKAKRKGGLGWIRARARRMAEIKEDIVHFLTLVLALTKYKE